MTTFAQACEKIRKDPASSFWLKHQINSLNERDPVDALHDCETLTSLQQLRCQELGIDSTPVRFRRFTITDEAGVVLETDGDFLMDDEGMSQEEKIGVCALVVNAECKIGGGAAPLLTVRRTA